MKTFIFVSLLVSTSSFAQENNPRYCTAKEVRGYGNISRYMGNGVDDGMIYIEGESARELYVRLESVEGPTAIEDIGKLGSGYNCFKQFSPTSACATYNCILGVKNTKTGQLGF